MSEIRLAFSEIYIQKSEVKRDLLKFCKLYIRYSINFELIFLFLIPVCTHFPMWFWVKREIKIVFCKVVFRRVLSSNFTKSPTSTLIKLNLLDQWLYNIFWYLLPFLKNFVQEKRIRINFDVSFASNEIFSWNIRRGS